MAASKIERSEERVKVSRSAYGRIQEKGTLKEQRASRKQVRRATRKLAKARFREKLIAARSMKKKED